MKWGLGAFPEGMLHLANMTHLTLSCHYGVTQLPLGIARLNKLQVRRSHHAGPLSNTWTAGLISGGWGLPRLRSTRLFLSFLPKQHLCEGFALLALYEPFPRAPQGRFWAQSHTACARR